MVSAAQRTEATSRDADDLAELDAAATQRRPQGADETNGSCLKDPLGGDQEDGGARSVSHEAIGDSLGEQVNHFARVRRRGQVGTEDEPGASDGAVDRHEDEAGGRAVAEAVPGMGDDVLGDRGANGLDLHDVHGPAARRPEMARNGNCG
jgi:hypothetical protein